MCRRLPCQGLSRRDPPRLLPDGSRWVAARTGRIFPRNCSRRLDPPYASFDYLVGVVGWVKSPDVLSASCRGLSRRDPPRLLPNGYWWVAARPARRFALRCTRRLDPPSMALASRVEQRRRQGEGECLGGL